MEAERRELRHRRDDIAHLLAEGLLTAASARPQLAALAERLELLNSSRTALPVHEDLLARPTETWRLLTQPQRRTIVRILFESITLLHVGPGDGPRADPKRIAVQCASTGGDETPITSVGPATHAGNCRKKGGAALRCPRRRCTEEHASHRYQESTGIPILWKRL